MKKLFFIFLSFFIFQQLEAQKIYAWWDCGVKAGYGLTGFLNSNLTKDDNYSYHLNTGYGLGAKFGMYFGLRNGITFDFMYSKSKQAFDYAIPGNAENEHSISWNNYDLALLYRNQSNGAYVELGPMYSLVKKVSNSDSNDGGENKDVANFYNKNYWSGVFGVGGYIAGTETFTLMLGLRLGYALTDFVSDEGKKLNYPTPKQTSLTAKDSKTNPAFVQLVMEGNFALGYYGKTSCSKRAHLFGF
ncbi:MAG: outer membrane beta-barrel protein [Saprospiraceae bacterium]|nr:outer membrane beta-barrel protein [Saprospiraceae bacterium]